MCLHGQIKHADDSFLTLTTDGINFLLSDQEICDVINKCADPTEAADVITQQVRKALIWLLSFWHNSQQAWKRHQITQEDPNY